MTPASLTTTAWARSELYPQWPYLGLLGLHDTNYLAMDRFDSSRDRGSPLATPIGVGRLIQGTFVCLEICTRAPDRDISGKYSWNLAFESSC